LNRHISDGHVQVIDLITLDLVGVGQVVNVDHQVRVLGSDSSYFSSLSNNHTVESLVFFRDDQNLGVKVIVVEMKRIVLVSKDVVVVLERTVLGKHLAVDEVHVLLVVGDHWNLDLWDDDLARHGHGWHHRCV